MAVPILETGRLRLRPHHANDFNASLAMWSDPAVTRYIGGKPSSAQQTWARMMNYAGQWGLLGFGYWAIEERLTGNFVGELGWALVSLAHGKGYATEAVRAAVAWGDANLPSTRTVCLIDQDNLASIRVAQKCGYRMFGSAAFNARPTLFFERTVTQH